MQVRGDASRSTVIVIDNSTHSHHPNPHGKVAVCDVLAALDKLDKTSRIKVLDFMEREFSTRMVKELQDIALLRTLKYVQAVLKAG
jgi:hypothetical protein